MRVLRFLIVVFLCIVPASFLQAQDESQHVGEEKKQPIIDQATAAKLLANETQADNAKELASKDADALEEERAEKKKKALAGFLMLGLVCIIFLFFVLAVTIVSSRLRKEAAQKVSKSQQADPLWYLKKQKAGSQDISDESS
jgi:hypothetical protein